MLINSAALAALRTGFQTTFQRAFAGVDPDWDKIATEVRSSNAQETYGWLGDIPGMREWIGDRVINNLTEQDYVIRNRKFESTVAVGRDNIEDDELGIYTPLFSEMGRAAAEHPSELVYEALVKGFDAPCYDGQNFFDADHPVGTEATGVASVSNFQDGAAAPWFLMDNTRKIRPIIFQNRVQTQFDQLDKPSDENVFMQDEFIYGTRARRAAGYGLWQLAHGSKADLDPASYAAARGAMMSYVNDHGRKLGVRPKLLVVGPSNEVAAREILMAERNEAGATNVWRNTAELLVTPFLE